MKRIEASLSLSFDKMASNDRAQSLVNDSLVKEYKENGAVCIRQMLNKDEIELIRKGILIKIYPIHHIYSKSQVKMMIQGDLLKIFVHGNQINSIKNSFSNLPVQQLLVY